MPGDADTFFRSVLRQNDRAPYTVSFRPLSAGVEGTAETLAMMAAAVRGEIEPDYSGFQDEAIRSCAISIIAATKGHDAIGEIHALFYFVRDRIKYVRDPIDLERVQDAARTLQLKTGDCDDKCVLLASLLASIGYLPRFTVQSQDGHDFDHVYVEVFDDQAGEWIPLDPTADCLAGTPCGFPGWRHPALVEWTYQIFPTGDKSMMNLAVRASLGQIGQSPYDDAWYERYIYDTTQKVLDVIGTAKTDTPYIPPSDPRYRNPQQVYVPVSTPAPAAAAAAAKKQSSSSFQLGQTGIQINYMTAALVLGGFLLFFQGRRGGR
jgi:Transglutaminase-like superfamily